MAGNEAFQTPERAALSVERRRMVRSRRFLQAALTHPAADWATRRAFILTCVEQLRIAVLRMIAQDLSLADQLRAVLPADLAADHAYLDEMHERLTLRSEELGEFVAASEQLGDGEAALEAFAAAVHRFFDDSPSQKRSRPAHSLPPLIETYGSPDAWAVAQHVADEIGSELEAFERVEATAYPGLGDLVAAAEQQAPARRKPA
jgi:hypothetical protein